MIISPVIRTIVAPRPNRTPFACEDCGKPVTWNQGRTRITPFGRRKVCRGCERAAQQ